jgi:hypothetical protein
MQSSILQSRYNYSTLTRLFTFGTLSHWLVPFFPGKDCQVGSLCPKHTRYRQHFLDYLMPRQCTFSGAQLVGCTTLPSICLANREIKVAWRVQFGTSSVPSLEMTSKSGRRDVEEDLQQIPLLESDDDGSEQWQCPCTLLCWTFHSPCSQYLRNQLGHEVQRSCREGHSRSIDGGESGG